MKNKRVCKQAAGEAGEWAQESNVKQMMSVRDIRR
jgi:hypothetical protein